MADKVFSKFDNNKYLWRSMASNEGAVRLLGGGELAQDTLNRFIKGDQVLFIGANLDVPFKLPETRLIAAARDAWLWLRFHLPIIATRVDPRDDGTSTLEYRFGDIDGWCNRTFKVVRQPQLDLGAFRIEVGKNKVPSLEGDQTWAYLLLGPQSTDSTVSSFGFLIHTHHAPFDGNGLKIVMNRYLAQLAKSLGPSDLPQVALQWGQEVSNLTPAVFNILLPSVPTPVAPHSSEEPGPDHPYYASLLSFLQPLGQTLENPYGFKPRKADPDWPTPGYESVLFTTEESANILAALKPKGRGTGIGYTVSHLAQAALAMTVIADNPPSSEATTQYLNNLHLRDSRNLLVEPYSSREGYPGYALGVGVLRIPVSLFLSAEGKTLPLDKSTLTQVTRAVRDLYAEQRAIPDGLNYMGLVAEIFCANIIAGAKANMLQPVNCYSFSSDGISEKFFDHDITDSSGQTRFKLSKFLMSLNHTDPAPFFRITSWDGAIELSADFNANLVSAGEVKVYLENWKRFMLLGANFGDEDL